MHEVPLVPLSKALRELMWKAQNTRDFLEQGAGYKLEMQQAASLAVVVQRLGKLAEALESGLLDPVYVAWLPDRQSYVGIVKFLEVAPPVPSGAEGTPEKGDHADGASADLGEHGRTRKGST